MIEQTGTDKIIDFGAPRVAGVLETAAATHARSSILGAAQYTAPGYFLGLGGTVCSDLFSLGVVTHQMLSGRLPYGADRAPARTQAAQRKLRYASVLHAARKIPAWVDNALRKAVQPDPNQGHETRSEFVQALRQRHQPFLNQTCAPLFATRYGFGRA